MNLRTLVTMVAIELFLLGTGTQAATLSVPSQYSTLREALAGAASGDVIELAVGRYPEHDLVVPAGVTIVGTGTDPREVTIDGSGQGRLLLLESLAEAVTIRNVALMNGHAQGPSSYDQSGGALLISNSLARIENCIFTANQADSHGGAIRCTNSSPEIVACQFYGNAAPGGGGGAVDLSYNSSALITDCVFLGNRAGWGGGLSCRGGSSGRVENGDFSGNIADGMLGFGGGVFADHFSYPDLQGTTIADNQARFGGAMVSFPDGPINLDYCTVVNNRSTVLEGGILVVDAVPLITGCIVAFNEGRGIGVAGPEMPRITCTNIFGNTAGDWGIKLADLASRDGNMSVDPQFCSLSAGDESRFHLKSSSPMVQPDSQCGTLGAKPVSCTGDKEETKVPAASAAIERVMAAPNPFNPQTTVSFELTQAQEIRVSIYGMDGRLVQVLGEGSFSPGSHQMEWTGRDQSGRQVSSGMYFVMVKGRTDTQKLKITLLK